MDGAVYALTVYNGELIAGGDFWKAGGVDANDVAGWDGSNWHQLGSGVGRNDVFALTVYDDEPIAGGEIHTVGGVIIHNIARWDGSEWQSLGSGTNWNVNALTVYNGELIAGGNFTTAGGIPSAYWARWGVPDVYTGDLNHDCAVNWYDVEWLVGRWLDDDCMYNGWCYEADLNYDFIVDFEDFAKLGDNWHPALVGDFETDGKVDMGDLEVFARWWLQNKVEVDIAPPGGDGIVNFFDYALFAANWLAEL